MGLMKIRTEKDTGMWTEFTQENIPDDVMDEINFMIVLGKPQTAKEHHAELFFYRRISSRRKTIIYGRHKP